MVWHKKFGPAQNILGPVKGQGIGLQTKLRQNLKIPPNTDGSNRQAGWKKKSKNIEFRRYVYCMYPSCYQGRTFSLGFFQVFRPDDKAGWNKHLVADVQQKEENHST